MSSRPSDYEILGCRETDTNDIIKKAYRQKALAYHPDRHPNASSSEKTVYSEKFKELSAAFSRVMRARSNVDGDTSDISDSESYNMDSSEFGSDWWDEEILNFFGIDLHDLQQFNELAYLVQNDALVNTFGNLVFSPLVSEIFVTQVSVEPPPPPPPPPPPRPRPQQQLQPLPHIIDLEFHRRSFEKQCIKKIKLKLGKRLLRIQIKLNRSKKNDLNGVIDEYIINHNKYKLPTNIIIRTKLRDDNSSRTGGIDKTVSKL